jgi:hypothetical protein
MFGEIPYDPPHLLARLLSFPLRLARSSQYKQYCQ